MSSLPLGKFQNEKYIVTCAGWNGGYGYSYELGVRLVKDGTFTLIQNRIFNRTNIVSNGQLAFRILMMNISIANLLNVFEAFESRDESDEFFKEAEGDLR